MAKKKKFPKPKRCKKCNREALAGKDYCRRHSWLGYPAIHSLAKLHEEDPTLFRIIAWGLPIFIALIIGFYYGNKALTQEDVSDAVVKTFRDDPELLHKPVRNVLKEAGFSMSPPYTVSSKSAEAAAMSIIAKYPSSEAVILRKLDLATEALFSDRYNEADAHLETLIDLYPDIPQLHVYLAQSLIGQGRFADAKHELQEAIRIEPNDATSRANLGWVWLRLGEGERAITEFAEALRLDPGQKVVYLNLGYIYSDVQRFGQAKEAYRIALQADSTYPSEYFAAVYMGLGGVYYDQDSFFQAGQNFEKAVSNDSTNPFAYHNLALAYHKVGELDKCIEARRAALRLKPELSHTRYLLAQALSEKGERTEAELQIKIILQTDPGYFKRSFDNDSDQ